MSPSFFIPLFKICFERRFEGDKLNDCLLSVDGIDFQILEPYPYEKEWSKRWYSHKFKKPGLRYEIALSIIGGDMCWVNGAFACGLYNDWSIFNTQGLREQLEINERVEADKGYEHGDPQFCKTPAAVFHKKEADAMRRRVMGRQEAINKKVREWQALKRVFRHDMSKHSNVFGAVIVICQLKIQNGEPLYSCEEYSDDIYDV